MFGFLAKVVVGGVGMYAVTKLCEKAQVAERVTGLANDLLTLVQANEVLKKMKNEEEQAHGSVFGQ